MNQPSVSQSVRSLRQTRPDHHCGVFLVAFQIRYSIETIEVNDAFLYVPFRLKPATDIVASVGLGCAREAVHSGDEPLAVNGRPFTRSAVHHQELRAARRYLDSANRLPAAELDKATSSWPFRVTVRSPSGDVRTREVNFPNCTCGAAFSSQVIWYRILPPAFCIQMPQRLAPATSRART